MSLPVLIVVLTLWPPPRALAGQPTEQLKTAVDRVIRVLGDPALKSPRRTDERRRAIREVSDSIFDWQGIARRSLGMHWRERTDAERAQFVGLFRDLLEQAYVAKLEGYRGERVSYVGESVGDGGVAKVRTVIDGRADQPIPVDYLMLRQGERWLVDDVVIENVSLVGNYRSQFNDIIRTASYAQLVKRMEGKIAAMRAADR